MLVDLATQTEISFNGNEIAIESLYESTSVGINTLDAYITNNAGIDNGEVYIEGELLIDEINHPQDISYALDNQGNLIVTASDAANYSIDSDGNLIYTLPTMLKFKKKVELKIRKRNPTYISEIRLGINNIRR